MNKNTLLPFVIGSVAIILTLFVVFIQISDRKLVTAYTPPLIMKTDPTASIMTSSTKKPLITPVTTVQADGYTLTQVSTHNKRSNCWTTINGGVYNVTSWINQHPGGAGAIIGLCGIDASSAFNGQHTGDRRPASELASFKIGILK